MTSLFFQLAGRDVQPPAQQHFQRGQILHLPGRILLHALQQCKAPGCIRLQYVLGLRPRRRAELSADQSGTLMHWVLQMALDPHPER
mgnify:CR=1 FL=1